MLKKITVCLFALGVIVAVQREAKALDSLYGGHLARRPALAFAVGAPGIDFEYYFMNRGRLNVGFGFNFYYVNPVHGIHVALGDQLHIPIRIGLLERGMFGLALKIDPGILLNYYGSSGGYGGGFFIFGIQPTIGVFFGVKVIPEMEIIGGLNLPFSFLIDETGGFTFVAPIGFNFGLDFHASSNMNIFLRFQVGPSIAAGDYTYNWRGGSGAHVDVVFLALLGMEFGM